MYLKNKKKGLLLGVIKKVWGWYKTYLESDERNSCKSKSKTRQLFEISSYM